MLRLLVTLGLFGGLVVAATADDTPAKQGDNPPGEKKEPEMKGMLLFKKIDADGDGKISKDELKDFLNTVAPAQLRGREGLLNRFFKQADADKDGYLSPEEFRALMARFRQRFGQLPKQ